MSEPERVLVVPTAFFHRLGHFHGFTTKVDQYLPALLEPAHLQYLDRPAAENDPGFKQLIPYVVFRCGEQVFRYQRGSGSGEARLRALWSVGVGGHICAADGVSGVEAYFTGMRRELDEEVHVHGGMTDQIIGLINDDLTPVGQVHLGIVHLVDLTEPSVRRREQVLTESGFAPLSELRPQRERFETWSQFLLHDGILD